MSHTLETRLQKFAPGVLQIAPIEELRLEVEVSTNPDDKKLLESAVALHQYAAIGLFGGNCLYLDKGSVYGAVGASMMGAMSAQTKRNLSVDLSQLPPLSEDIDPCSQSVARRSR